MPVGHAITFGRAAQASGVTTHLLTVLTALGAAGMERHSDVSYSVDRTISPLGHCLLVVLYFDPVSPAPHSVMVSATGIENGLHSTAA